MADNAPVHTPFNGHFLATCLHVPDEKKLQQTVDEVKASEAEKYDELIAANKEQISQLQCDNESLKRVLYVTICL